MSIAFVIVEDDQIDCSVIHHMFCVSLTFHSTGTPESLKDLASKTRLGKALPLTQKGRLDVVLCSIFCSTEMFWGTSSLVLQDRCLNTVVMLRETFLLRNLLHGDSLIQKMRDG